MDTIASLQTFADERHLNLDVARAFAALDPDTAYNPVGRIERIQPATPEEIAWASAHVRPLTPLELDAPAPGSKRERWYAAARQLGTFTSALLYQHARGSIRDARPMLRLMLDAGVITQIQEFRRFVQPAIYRWAGEGSSQADALSPDLSLNDPPCATLEERWRHVARQLGTFTPDVLRELALGGRDLVQPMLRLMLDAGEIEQIQANKRGRAGHPALYRWIGGDAPPPPTCR